VARRVLRRAPRPQLVLRRPRWNWRTRPRTWGARWSGKLL